MAERAFEKEQSAGHEADEARPAPSLQLMARQADARRQQSAHLVQRLRVGSGAVQRKGGGSADAVHRAAAHGIQGSGGSMPHLGAIQKSFGRHDVSSVPAHVGGNAAEASSAMGAEAYATKGAVAFKRSPDLHTAAHEAAHVVQQRDGVQLKGGVGEVGDRYERHADAVADRVVQGRSAEDLLDAGPGGGGASPVQQVVQREESGDDGGGGDEPWWRLAPEVSIKSPLITGFNQGPEAKLSIDPGGAISGGASISGSIAKDFGGSFEHPMGAVLVKVLASGEFGVKAKGGFAVTGAIKKHEGEPDKDYADLTIGPRGAVEFVASGKIAAGPALGVKDVANVSVMVYGQLEAKFETAVAIDGGLRWGKDGLKGVLKMPVDMKGGVTLSGGILVVAEFVKEDIELAELKVAEVDIARAGVKCTPTATMPGGAVAGGKPEFTKPEFVLNAQPKVQKVKNLLGPALLKLKKDIARKQAEMQRQKAQSEANFQQAQNQRASQLGVDPADVTPDQRYTPVDQPQASGVGPNASYDPGPAADDGPNMSGGGPNASYDPGMSVDPSQS